MKQKPYLRLVLKEPLRIVISQTELEHLLQGHAIGFHIDAIDLKIEIDRQVVERLDPPEAIEYRRRPK